MAITLVSEATTGNSGNNPSYTSSPGGRAVSSDGRYVVYHSTATDLVANDLNGATADIFLYDSLNDTTTLISKDISGGGTNGGSYSPSISADGRYVVYYSSASNLVTGDTNSRYDIFLYDTVGNTTTLISKNTSGGGADENSTNSSISGDGRYVVYYSQATDLVTGDTNGFGDIFLYDTVNETTVLVSKDTSGRGAGNASSSPTISADGRYVVYHSDATNLVAGDTNSRADIFVYDTLTGTTELVTIDTGGSGTDNNSYYPSISGDGSTIFFQSYASDLVTIDSNSTGDVFLADNPLFGAALPTVNQDTLAGDAGDNTVTFDNTTLTNGDSYDGLGGTDTVFLAGGGVFDFGNTTFTSVENIRTDGSNTVFDFSGFGSTEADREA